MSFPLSHKACSQLQFQFALVDSQIDGCHGCQNSSAVTSALSAASPTDGRSQDCRGCVWGEPLGCGLREVEVVGGGFVLFGGRWGEGGTQVTPLTWEDMVSAQQELEQHSLPYVPSELDSEKEQEGEGGETKDWGTLEGAPAEIESAPLSVSALPPGLSSSSPTFASHDMTQRVQSEADLSRPTDRVTVTGKQTGGGGGILVVSPASAAGSSCHPPASVSAAVFLQKGQSEVRGERRGDGGSDQSFRFAPAALMKGSGGKRADVFGGEIEETVSGGMGEGDPVSNPSQRVRESQCVLQETPTEGDGVSAVCEGLKRRRLSSLSVSISAPRLDRRVGGQAFVSERVSSVSPFLSLSPQQSSLQKSCLSSHTVPHPFRIHDTHITLDLDRVGGVSGERSLKRGTEYDEDVYSDRATLVGDRQDLVGAKLCSRSPRSPPQSLSSTHLLECQRGEGHRTQGVAVPLKRRRSEAALSEAEADECDVLSGFPVAGEGVTVRGEKGCVVREKKQRRLTVSVSD
uniref:Uncharacterized protein n=1 Tax=Chromera velia CCMP2878 TaxID=1169474 RepID=A0A0G4F620_9ALVE|eukprot:Cvel_15190.t1-p1 / transcript=Cvel_15190.t1 / gene=Cvel_15190 / organism=Chromera_velia_CCMP2878 / gene_product=hypothetical protein / transcript_product=hypothetical protein / location=Cvel_scaffold1110:50497-52041(+) / protein_length=515 / sequence_SO=supercontig / SO=protein_coding / is_pseudo=false